MKEQIQILKNELEHLKLKIQELEKSKFNTELNIEMVDFTACEKPFRMAKYLCTQELWEKVTGNNPSYFYGNPKFPVEEVSYDDIVNSFLPKLNEITGKKYRLPTEYEWILCATVDSTIYSGSDNVEEVAIFNTKKPSDVGLRKPNTLGIYDLSGNVWEWCSTNFNQYFKVLRGGSWISLTQSCCVVCRDYFRPVNRSFCIGFRLVESIE